MWGARLTIKRYRSAGWTSVRDYVVTKGVESSRVSGQGFGESKPIADNKTAEGRAKNRRVEIKVN